MLLFFLFLLGCTAKTIGVCIDENCFQVEIAGTPEEQAKGLMHRYSLPEDGGMLFAFDSAKIAKFWMKNTLIPLDMIWIYQDEIVYIEHNAQPCKEEPCQVYGPEQVIGYVLEINGGKSRELGIEVGDTISVFP